MDLPLALCLIKPREHPRDGGLFCFSVRSYSLEAHSFMSSSAIKGVVQEVESNTTRTGVSVPSVRIVRIRR